MSILRVRGYGRGSMARMLCRRSKVQDDVKVLPELPLEANIGFERVRVAYDKENYMRPYLQFTDGRISSVQIKAVREFAPELNVDEIHVSFDPGSAPELSCRWNLSNAEIAALVPKCLFGSDYSVDHVGDTCPYRRPRMGDGMNMAEEFTSSIWEGIPMTATMRMLVDFESGVPVPVISIEPELDNNELVTNSRISGYMDISVYIPEKTYQTNSLTEEFEDIFAREDFGIDTDAEPVATAETKPGLRPVSSFKPMTPSEQQEAAIVAGLAMDVAESVEARLAGDDIELAVEDEDAEQTYPDDGSEGRYDLSSDGREVMEDMYEAAAIQSGDAFGIEELEAFGLMDKERLNAMLSNGTQTDMPVQSTGPVDHHVYEKEQKNNIRSVMAAAQDMQAGQEDDVYEYDGE